MSSYNSHTDEQLVLLLRNNDEGAFTEIYTRYWNKLFAVACHRLNNEMEAEGIVQDIFVSLWERRERLMLSHTLNTYLSVAVKYQVIMHLARIRRREKFESRLARTFSEGEDTISGWLSEKELKAQIEQGIHQLPEKCRLVFTMSRSGVKNALIAQRLHISEKTVEGHITKALRVLRASLKLLTPLLIFIGYKN